jgi:gliding motility-associated-like protein
MKSVFGFIVLIFSLILPLSFLSYGQSDRGKIIKAASSVLDPNGDGFVSLTNAGFSFDGYYVDEFEIKMFGIPQLNGDVTGDNIGKNCGITDLIPDRDGHSVYAVRDASNNLIFRFRVGDDNPSVEAWTILLDTDGLFGANDPNATAENPGFEIDITLIKNSNKGVLVYNIDGIQSCPTPVLTYPFSTHFQIAIADIVSCGDPDYFYDIYVPFSQIAAQFGIDENTGLRYAAVTNVSATCAMAGKIADISGVDYKEYKNCVPCAFSDLINNQCPTPVADLCETCFGFNRELVDAPTINEPVRAGQTQITGTSQEGIYIVVSVYSRTGGTDENPIWSSTPREQKGAYANGIFWGVTLSDPLQAYDKIVARAQLDEFSVPCGGDDDNTSSTSVTVVEPNDRPVANDQVVDVFEDTPKLITLTGSDPDGDPITYSIVSNPTKGTLSGTPPNITYTPNLNYNGSDSFTFQVSDGIYNATVAGIVTINVLPVNDPPVANNQSVTVVEDVPKSITLTGSDIDGDALTYSIVTPPSNGTLSGTAPNLTYTPNLNFNGSDSFTFRVNDGTVNSNTATVSITVTPVNDAPVANNQSVTVTEDVAKAIVLTGSDVDGNPLTYILVSSPSNGTLTGSGANRTYTPNLNYNGADSFTFKVSDGALESSIATVSITVTPVNDAPTASNQSVTVVEDTPKSITLTGNDVDGDVLTFIVQNPPTRGTLSGTAPNLTYTPNLNYNGSDSFTFIVNDGTVNSATATVFITVTPVSDPPVADDQSVSTQEDVQLSITLTGSDPDGDALTFIVVSGPSNGVLSGTVPNLTYSPNLDYFGSDSFTFKVNDGSNDSNIATVSITVTPDNDPPIADNQNVTYDFNTPKVITLTGSDVDGDPITFTVLTQPANGVLSGTAPNLTYTPNTGFTGSDSFTFVVNDGNLDSDVATVSLNMAPITNNDPVANDQSATVTEDVPKSIMLTASDVDGDPLTYTIVSGPTNGALSGSGANRTYTPSLNYNGSDSFTFKVNDGTVDSNIATVSITVTPVNDAPVAHAQSVTTQEDVEKTIILTGSDVEGSPLTFVIVTPPSKGTLTDLGGSGASQKYTPALNYTGSDSFTFRVNDGSLNSNIATVSITITPVNDAPVANDDITVTTDEDTPVTFNIIENDEDVDGTINPSSVDLDPSTPGEDKTRTIPGEGTYTVNASGLVTFTPVLNYNGTTTPINYTVKDDLGALSNEAAISVLVNPVNDAPVPQDATVSVNEDEQVEICITVTDVEGDPSVLTDVSDLNGNGTVTIGNNLCFTYTPNPDFNGPNQVVVVTVCDANDLTLCNTATITIHVDPVNDAPVIIIDNQPATVVNYTTPEDTPLDFCFVAEDVDGDVISVDSYSNITGGGTLNLNSSVDNEFCFTYTPILNFNGLSTWQVRVCDGDGLCAQLTINIDVTPVNDPPIADDQLVNLMEDEIDVDIILTGSDIDNDPLSYLIVANPVNGQLTGSGANRKYTPKPNYFGADSIKFKVNDGTVDSNIATVRINVQGVNDAPVITTLILEAKEDSILQVCLNVVDVDGDNVVFDQPVNTFGGGTMTPDPTLNFCFVFTPDLHYNGLSVWQMRACDSQGVCGTAEVKITVLPVNDPPVANDDTADVPGGATTGIDVLINDRPIVNPYEEFYDFYVARDSVDKIQIVRVQSFNGSAVINNNKIDYTPNFEVMGSDSVRYWIRDSGGLMDSAMVYIEVGPSKFRIFEAVSPNNDGLNDYWRINGIDQDPGNLVRLFDRFNNMVFEMKGYSNESDNKRWYGQSNHGLINGNLPEGTYYYVISIDLTEDNQGERIFKGYVILKRN